MKAVDAMGFAGSMAAGIDQAQFDIISKVEPASFKGFGVESFQYNMPWVPAQVAPFDEWETPDEKVELVYGCPPCSGFSQLSSINSKVYEHTGVTYRGADAEINECMTWFIDYTSRVKPRIAIMESVGAAYKLGREFMESLVATLREKSGLPYELAHVNMDAALVGGDVVRKRYFFVAHLDPFGIGLDFVQPRNLIDVISDLGSDEDMTDTDWGHMTRGTKSTDRIRDTILWLNEMGRDWAPGTRLPQNTEGLEPPEFWIKDRPSPNKRGYREDVYSHWYSTDPFSPVRWRPNKPFGVIVAASLDRAIHPIAPRPITYREGARFMSLPDTWSMRVLLEKNRPDELGKAVPSASAKWISHWARMAIEGTPGEYAGEDTGIEHVKIYNVQRQKDIDLIINHPTEEMGFWPPNMTSDPDPAGWLIDRKQRPGEWWQREDELGIMDMPIKKPRTSKATRSTEKPVRPTTASTITRIKPEVVAAFLKSLGMTEAQAAEKLGLSGSRIRELTTNTRPKSHLNADRWDDVQATLRS